MVGVDISEPLIDHAGVRAGTGVRFICADAEDADLPAVDVAISRFGIMFFRDTERAFSNIARALASNGRCAFACWQPLDQNPWITWPVAAIADMVPDDARSAYPSDADVPGPFRFADAARLTATMRAAGFSHADARRVSQPLSIAGTTAEIMALVERVGPLSRVLNTLDEVEAARARERVQARLESMHDGRCIELGAAWWLVTGSMS